PSIITGIPRTVSSSRGIATEIRQRREITGPTGYTIGSHHSITLQRKPRSRSLSVRRDRNKSLQTEDSFRPRLLATQPLRMRLIKFGNSKRRDRFRHTAWLLP